MKENLNKVFIKLFEENQIPFMQITQKDTNKLDIKVYFPKIVLNICKFLDKRFIIKDKENINLRKNKEGYYEVELFLIYKKEEINITISSILKNTWGIANKL